jgi:16S rRNA (cytosine967-C5)-methyltransferase
MAKEKLFESYLNTACSLIQRYDGSIPLNDFLKQYFSQYKKFGSRDRKYISHLSYCYYRLGQASSPHSLKGELLKQRDENDLREKIITALLLCSHKQNELLSQLKPEWNETATLTLDEKLTFLNRPFKITDIFPWQDELSEPIDATAFASSHLIQPDLYLRIRPNKRHQILKKLQEQKIEFKECGNDCLALSNSTRIENLLEINKEVVIQDYSSQRIKEFLEPIKSQIRNLKSKIRIWDCCAASGGKSILAFDVLKNIDLTVSDIRPSIIHNLKQRFKKAEIKNYTAFIVDLIDLKSEIRNPKFDIIICDAPCTGSGTWSRTPEQLYFFKKEKINYYVDLQKKIVSNIIPGLARNGYLLYITCSVFKKENEEVIEFIRSNFKLELVKQEALIGYDKKADTMFAALLKKVDNLENHQP